MYLLFATKLIRMRDYTLKTYSILCETLKSRHTCSVKDYLQNKPSEAVILRHDVDVSCEKALRMAEVEESLGICSSYYFRYTKTFNPEIMKKIEDMGHEVGYHYEVLDKTKGDLDDAIMLFEKEIGEFRKHVDVQTISMHGSVLSKHNNLNLWDKHDFSDYGLVGEAYLSLSDKEIQYFTDTGRNWSGRYSLKDKLQNNNLYSSNISSTLDLIVHIKKTRPKLIYLNIHPKRWSSSLFEWFWELSLQSVKNIGKSILIHG
jgi:hypothetical protein